MVGFGSDFSKNAFVGLATIVMVVKIIVGIRNIKNRVFSITDWLVDMQIQADSAHLAKLLMFHGFIINL